MGMSFWGTQFKKPSLSVLGVKQAQGALKMRPSHPADGSQSLLHARREHGHHLGPSLSSLGREDLPCSLSCPPSSLCLSFLLYNRTVTSTQGLWEGQA